LLDQRQRQRQRRDIKTLPRLAALVSEFMRRTQDTLVKLRPLKATAKAILAIQKQKASTADDAADFLYSQVVKFAASPAGNKGEYTPHCATWMNAGRYFDDPTEWHTLASAQRPNDSQFVGSEIEAMPCPLGQCDGSGWYVDVRTRNRIDCRCQRF